MSKQLSLDLGDSRQQALAYYKTLLEKCYISDSHSIYHSGPEIYIFYKKVSVVGGKLPVIYLGTRYHGPVETEYTYDYKISLEDACWLYDNFNIGTLSNDFLKYFTEYKAEEVRKRV